MDFGIIFDSASVFLEALKKVNYPETTITPQSANAHILVEQTDEQTLTLTAYGIDGIWMQQSIPSTQALVNEKYLILANDIPKITDSIRAKYGLALGRAEDGALTFSSVQGVIEGELNVLDTIVVQEFHGSFDEFGPAQFYEDPQIEISQFTLAQVLQLMYDFGGFAQSKELRGVYLVVEKGVASFYTNQYFNPNYCFRISVPCVCEGEFEFIFNARQFKAIQSCLDPKKKEGVATLAISGDEVTVTGLNGRVTVKTLSLERFLILTHAPHNFVDDPRIEQVGYRTVLLDRMMEAIEAQKPTKDHQGKALKIQSEEDHLIISKLADARLREHSFVPVLTLEERKTSFPTLAYTASAMIQVLKTLKAVQVKEGVGSIAIQLRVIKAGTRYGLYAALVNETPFGEYEILAAVTEPREGDI
ncbi:hypothetical protein ACQ4M3_09375 [Leptolyngbya sp. AN03gr2]|uniref:hypothetical protein n=1 Tax=Leptolyngbya sp. AN03gr2 TaxID=3423364 RepID=UPI003D315F02